MSLFPETLPTDAEILAFLPLAEFKAHLRLTDTAEDAVAEAILLEVYRVMDGRDGYLGRAILPQTWRLVLDYFPARIVLPLPNLISIASIKYLSSAGDEVTLSPGDYAVISGDRARIIPAKGKSWPSTWDFPAAVEVTFQAGFADVEAIPPPIKRAIFLQAATIFENRESILVGNFALRPLRSAMDLLTPYREMEF
ncbi:MAG: hypothetical protein AB7F96_04330 [Beijerinckiaceae bacterium]